MYRIIQGKRSHYTWLCSIHLHILKCTGTLLKRRIFHQPFHMKLQWLNCVWKVRLRKIKISFIWICAVKQVCKFCLSVFWTTFCISYLSRFFPLVDEDLCPVESGRGAPGDLHQEPTSAVWTLHFLVMFEFFNTRNWLNHTAVGH